MATGQSDLGNASTEVTSSQMTLAYVKLIAESDCDNLINLISTNGFCYDHFLHFSRYL